MRFEILRVNRTCLNLTSLKEMKRYKSMTRLLKPAMKRSKKKNILIEDPELPNLRESSACTALARVDHSFLRCFFDQESNLKHCLLIKGNNAI